MVTVLNSYSKRGVWTLFLKTFFFPLYFFHNFSSRKRKESSNQKFCPAGYSFLWSSLEYWIKIISNSTIGAYFMEIKFAFFFSYEKVSVQVAFARCDHRCFWNGDSLHTASPFRGFMVLAWWTLQVPEIQQSHRMDFVHYNHVSLYTISFGFKQSI